MTGHLVGIGVPDAPDAWETIGCCVVDGAVPLANGALLLGREGLVLAEPAGAVTTGGAVSNLSFSLPGRTRRVGDRFDTARPVSDLEGVPLDVGAAIPPVDHPSGAFELDHVVLLTDSLERTSDAVHAVLGLERRRLRETDVVRQAFHRFADPPDGSSRGCIVEVVESDRVEATTLMGVVLNVADLFDLADRLGPDVMPLPKRAVQPGRYISTVRRGVGLGTAVAFMTPPS